MNSELGKYISIDKLKKIINYVYKEFKLPCWVVDNNGTIITSIGFSEICSNFHMTNMKCSSNCQKCYKHIIAELKNNNILYKKSTGILHKCDNGLFDIGVPIIINKRHIATLIAGQVLVGEMDKEYFRKQAIEFSFDEKEYLNAAHKVKTMPSESIETVIDMLLNLANLIKGSVFRIDNKKDIINVGKDIDEKSNQVKKKIVKGDINKDDIIDALEKNEFMVIYQPVVNTLTYAVESVEALVRWDSPKFGTINPGQFIDVAKKYELMSEIDKWMLKNICVQNSLWSYLGYKPINISLNISASTIKDESFFDIVNNYVMKSEVNLKTIQIEFSETETDNDFEAALNNINRLKEMGIKIVIDDFGKSYRFIKYIDRLKIDSIKIDKSFIDEVKDSKNKRKIFKNIIDIAHTNNVLVVAKGVEHTEVFDYLRFHKCDLVQGYTFSKEVYPERLDDILNAGVIYNTMN